MSSETKVLLPAAAPSDTRTQSSATACATRAHAPTPVACDTHCTVQSRAASGEGPQGIITCQHERLQTRGVYGHSRHETPSGFDDAALAARYARVSQPMSASYARFLQSIGVDISAQEQAVDHGVQLQRCDSPSVIAHGGASGTQMSRQFTHGDTASVPTTTNASPTTMAAPQATGSATHAPSHLSASETKVWHA